MKNRFLVALVTITLSLAGCDVPNGPTTVSDDVVVTVPANRTLIERIKAARINSVGTYWDGNHYDHADERITLGFVAEQVSFDYAAKMVEVRINRPVSTEQAVAEINTLGLRPANAAECLAYGAVIENRSQQPDAEDLDNYWIPCLGSASTVEGERYVLVLNHRTPSFRKWYSNWNVDHATRSGGWRRGARFLAVQP